MRTPEFYYRIIHDWLHKHYGKPSMCENENCKGDGKRFEYALIHGCNHERKRNNYLMLCSACHRRYDMTPERRRKAASHLAGKYNKNLRLGPETVKKPVRIVGTTKIFQSGKELADHIGCDKSSVYQVLSGRRKSIYGNKIEYAVD